MGESTPKGENLTWHRGRIQAADREALLRQRGCVVWLTGLSGSGKSTIACALEERLIRDGHPAFVLDGDNVRHGLNRDLGFLAEDREENIRRIGEVGALFAQAGVITIAAFISPYKAGRHAARAAAGEGRFFEVFLDTPLEACESRDPKGLYQKVRAGEISEFTGVDAPYEKPEHPELVIDTAAMDVAACAECIVKMLEKNGVFSV
jgi:adenylyl-sulfate kinase